MTQQRKDRRTIRQRGGVIIATLTIAMIPPQFGAAQDATPTPAMKLEHTTGDQSPIVHTESGNVNLTYGISEERFEALSEELAVTKSALKSFFKILEQEQVPREDLDSTLREIAAQYKGLLQRLEVIQSEDAEVVRLKTEARQAIEAGKFDEAETLLNQAEKLDIDAIRKGQEHIQQEKERIRQEEEAVEKRQMSAAETNADNARLQEIRLRYANAADYWRKAADLLPEGEQKKRSLYLSNAGNDFYRIARYADALPLCEQSLAIYREIGDTAGEGRTLNNISQIYYDRGDLTTALTYLEQSLAICKEIGDTAGEGATLDNIGQIYFTRGNYTKAFSYFEEALEIRREIGDKAGEGTTLNNIGHIYDAQGDYATAVTCLEQSLAILKEIGDKAGEGATLNNISQIYQARGDYATALTYLEQSRAILKEIGDKAGEGATCWNIGRIYQDQGDLAKAKQYISRSVEIAEETGHPDLEKRRTELERIRKALQKQGASGGE